jgi:hypothetical protein
VRQSTTGAAHNLTALLGTFCTPPCLLFLAGSWIFSVSISWCGVVYDLNNIAGYSINKAVLAVLASINRIWGAKTIEHKGQILLFEV